MKAGGGSQLNGYPLITEDEFLRTYHKYLRTVFGIALSYTKNDTDACDIAQEVFMKYYTSRKRFNDDEHLKAWLIRVTINACKKYLLSSWIKRTVPLDETIPFDSKEDSDLFSAVMDLPLKYRTVVHLHYYEGYSIAEIASLLKTKESTIKVRLMRARTKLKEKLKEVWLDE